MDFKSRGGIKEQSIGAVITRADGTVVNLGEISYIGESKSRARKALIKGLMREIVAVPFRVKLWWRNLKER